MLRAGAYFPPSRNGRSWSPSAAAPGYQERLALVMGIVPYTFTPPPLLHPLRYARPPDMGTVMLKTLPLEGGVPVRGRGYLSIREVLHPPLLHPLRFARPSKRGTVMRNARRSCIKIHFPSADDADNADFSSLYYTEWLLFICAICVICGRKNKRGIFDTPSYRNKKVQPNCLCTSCG